MDRSVGVFDFDDIAIGVTVVHVVNNAILDRNDGITDIADYVEASVQTISLPASTEIGASPFGTYRRQRRYCAAGVIQDRK